MTPDPDTAPATSETDSAGNVYTDFSTDANAGGQSVPHHVHYAATATTPAADDTITYNGDTQTFTNNTDHSSQTINPQTHQITSETDSAGNVYTDFSADTNAGGKSVPHHVHYAATATTPAADDTITYNNDGSQTVSDGVHTERVWYTNGQVSKWEQDGWTYTKDPNGITHGKNGSQRVDIYPLKDPGWTREQYYDGDKNAGAIIYDANHRPYMEWTPDGKAIMFSVELPKLADGIKQVSVQRDTIEAMLKAVHDQFQYITEAWQSPSGTNYAEFTTELQSVTALAQQILSSSIVMMKTTYNNYAGTEQQNSDNLKLPYLGLGPVSSP